jgi:Domain of unknown function (DUF4333)
MIVIERVCRVAAVVALVAAVSGCGTIATNDNVEDQVKSQLGAEEADCPTDLEGEVGRSIICKATTGDDTYDVKVTVTSVDGDTVNYGIERVGGPVAPTAVQGSQPATDPVARVDGKNVAQSVLDQLASTGKDVDEVTCPDLPARVGATERCTLVTGAETYGVTVTATSVQGTDVKFDIQVDQAPR